MKILIKNASLNLVMTKLGETFHFIISVSL